MPWGCWTIDWSVLSIDSRIPSETSPPLITPLSASSSRSAIFSPKLVGPDAARTSNFRPALRREKAPSCGRRRSAISMSAQTLRAETTAFPAAPLSVETFCMMPSMRQRTITSSAPLGSRWTSVDRISIAFSKICCTVFTAREASRSRPSPPCPSTGLPSFFRITTETSASRPPTAIPPAGNHLSNDFSMPSFEAARNIILRAKRLVRILRVEGALVSR